CVFDHLEVTMDPPNAGLQGFLNGVDTTGLRITNNRIHHVGFDNQFEHGIYCSHEMHAGLIEGNWIYHNAAFGIQFYPDCDDVTFRYNVVDDNGYSITLAGEGSTTSDRVAVENC